MNSFFRLLGYSVKRDFLQQGVTGFLLQGVKWVCFVAFWYFIAQAFGRIVPTGGDYFTFSLVGLAFVQYLWTVVSYFSQQVRKGLSLPAFSLFWSSPFSFPLLIFSAGIWNILSACLNSGLILVVGTYVFGANLKGFWIFQMMGIGLVVSISMGCLGILFGVSTQMVGLGNGLRPLLMRFILISSGIFFPLQLLPDQLVWAAYCFPLTHALILARGFSETPLSAHFQTQAWSGLLGTSVFFILAAYVVLRLALRQVRSVGLSRK